MATTEKGYGDALISDIAERAARELLVRVIEHWFEEMSPATMSTSPA